MSNGYTSDPSRLRVVRTVVLVVGTVFGVALGWLLFVVISWGVGLGSTREPSGDTNSRTAAPVEQGASSSSSSTDPYDPYAELALPKETPSS